MINKDAWMLHCLEEPIKQLKDVLDKLDRVGIKYHTNCPECDYLDSQVNDKEKFKSCIKEAIEKIEEAYRKNVEGINSTYPHYTPLKELEWVSKEEFDAWKGKELESNNASFGLIVIRYENGEHHLSQDGSEYGLYINNNAEGI